MKLNSKRLNIKDILMMALITVWGFLINRKISVTSLYKDDIYMWSFFDSDSFADFVLPDTGKRCRPVYWMFQWLEMNLIKNDIGRLITINIILLILIALLIYLFIRSFRVSYVLSGLAGMTFLTSRFAYYTTTQMIGLVETLATLFTLLICILLFEYMHSGLKSYFYVALVMYVIVCFTHERYMVLLPMFVYCAIVAVKKNWKEFVFPFIALALVIAVRFKMTGQIIPAGTGGTQVTETFTAGAFANAVLTHIKYLLGMSPGEAYLNGIEWAEVSKAVKLSVGLGAVCMLVIAVMFVLKVIKTIGKKKDRTGLLALRDVVFFAGFIIGSVVSSSVTVRVEMRWVYTSFAMLIILVSYMYAYVTSVKKSTLLSIVLAAFLILNIARDIYYRDYWNNIYLFTDETNVEIIEGDYRSLL